ncbi:unnamed protein product, partial [Didymodactylos carnosus]
YGIILNLIDFEKAFDSVHQESLWEILKYYGIPTKIIEIIKSLYEDAESCVKVNEEENTWFKIKTGVRHGCILSSLLFIIAIDWVLQKALTDQKLGIKLNHKQEIEDLDFADDIVLITDNTQKMQEKTDRIDTHSKSIGLKINAKKTNIMVVNENKFEDDVEIMVNNNKLAKAQEFMYLGSKISQSGDIIIEINNRIAKAAYALKALNKVWQNKGIPLKTKMQLYRANVIAVLIYSSETWQLTKQQQEKINSFDYICLRKILKINWTHKVSNAEIRERVKLPAVVQTMKKQRLRWFWHLIRMDRDRLAKQILQRKPQGGETRLGRPPTSWRETITRDLKEMGLIYDEAIQLARNKNEWDAFLLPIAPNGDWSNR